MLVSDQVLDVAHLLVLGLEVAGESILQLDLGGDALDDRDAADSSAATFSGLLVIRRTRDTPGA